MNIIWTAKNNLSTYCTTTYELTKTLYRCTYAPQARATESREEIIEKKCLQMRKVLYIIPIKNADAEEIIFSIQLSHELWKLLPESLSIDISAINSEEAYQQALSSLAANSNGMESPFHLILIGKKKAYGIVNYVKDCPDLFFNDLIQEVVKSDFSLKDKFYVINKVLECYNQYIDRCVSAHCLDDNDDAVTSGLKGIFKILNEHIVDTEEYREKLAKEGESPEYKKLRVNEGDLLSLKGMIINQLEPLLQSYKIALGSLPQLSKDCSWQECLDNINTFFRLDYCPESINILLKLISVLPDGGLKNRLNTVFINYLTFIKFNKDWQWGVFAMQLILYINGSKTWLNSIANPYFYAILVISHSLSVGFLGMTAMWANFGISFQETKSIENFNNIILFPLFYTASVIANCYAIGSWMYS